AAHRRERSRRKGEAAGGERVAGMDQLLPNAVSPHRVFSRSEWAALRADTPLTLTADEVARLRSLNDPVSLDHVLEIYLPLILPPSLRTTLVVAPPPGLYDATPTSLASRDGLTPFIIAIAGSVAVGKSTTARILKALLGRWPNTPKVDLMATDGFLLPNAVLN